MISTRLRAMQWLSVVALAMMLVACADTMTTNDGATGDDGGSDSYLPQVDGTSGIFPTINGRVRAPRGSLPVSGALVYALSVAKAVAPIPETVYCDKCVELEKDTPHAFSGPDGSFAIRLPSPGAYQLVTQKGAFRRVREINVPEGGMNIDADVTTLPFETNAEQGDTIPRMLVLDGAWDDIESSLMKMGLFREENGQRLPSFVMPSCVPDFSTFPPTSICNPVDPYQMFSNYDLIKDFQIIFIPCDGDFDEHSGPYDNLLLDPAVRDNLLRWIKDGGRLYVTDYQYDVLQRILPDYIHWEGESTDFGTAELTGEYDAPAIVNDDGLKQWLSLQGFDSFTLEDSWTIIKNVQKLPTPDPDQTGTYEMEPTTWISGDVPGYGIRPMTVGYPYGCGRILFSTYHTESSGTDPATLLPQERALLYIVLETAVCLEPPKVN